MKGNCLCGQVEFEITGALSHVYQCHCSLCQKASGTSACSGIITGIDGIEWLNGQDKISSYTAKNGYRTDFCCVCGSPVPNKMNLGEYVWIPAGSLSGDIGRRIAAHIHTDSKASWETNVEKCATLNEGPENIAEFFRLLNTG